MAARELTPQEVAAGERGISSDSFNATQVQALVRNMDTSKQKWRRLKNNPVEYEAKLRSENEKLYFNFPVVFDLHVKDKLDMTFFHMLALRRKVESGEVSQTEADRIIGQAMFQKFVPETVSGIPSTTPTLSYEEFYRHSRS